MGRSVVLPMGFRFFRRVVLFTAQCCCTVEKGVSALWAPIGWYPDPDRRKRPASSCLSDGIEAVATGGVKVGLGVE